VELSAYREAARLLVALLPCDPVSRATLRNGTHRVAADLERLTITKPNPKPAIDPTAEMMVLIDGAQIRAAHGDQSRHLDLTVGKIEVTGKPPKRFALAPKGAESPLATLRHALRDQGWQSGPPGDGVTAKRRFPVLSAPRSASPSPAFCIGGTSPCVCSISSKQFGASTHSTLNTGWDWRWSSGESDAPGT
jgi:hypothetical protein